MNSTQNEIRHFAAGKDHAGRRLDKLLAEAWPDISRARIQGLIRDGALSQTAPCEETIKDPSRRVKAGDQFSLRIAIVRDRTPGPEHMDLDILYEDMHVIVVDKPAGLVVHPAPGNRRHTLVNALIDHCGPEFAAIGEENRPGIVHRLDKDTSGLMVVARTKTAHEALIGQFKRREIKRRYHALIWGVPMPPSGTIEGNIGRNPHNRKKMAVLAQGGKPAVTRYSLLETFDQTASLAECRLQSGRTHQIRVHFSHIGHPLIGDSTYGRSRRKIIETLPEPLQTDLKMLNRQALHAVSLAFRHPESGELLTFECKMPHELSLLTEHLRAAFVRTRR